MSLLSTVTDGAVSSITGSLLPALLTLMGAILFFIVSVWAMLQIMAHIRGLPSESVFYKMGRIFGDLVYEERYQKFKSKQRNIEQLESFRKRYKKGL